MVSSNQNTVFSHLDPLAVGVPCLIMREFLSRALSLSVRPSSEVLIAANVGCAARR